MGKNFSVVTEQAEKLVETHEVNKENSLRSQQKLTNCTADMAKREYDVQQAQIAYQHAVQARVAAASRASDDENVDLSSYDALVSEAEYYLQNANAQYKASYSQYTIAVAEYNETKRAIELSGRELTSVEGQLRSIEDDYHEKSLYLKQLLGLSGGENAAEAIRHFNTKRRDALNMRNKVLRSLGKTEAFFVDDSDDNPGVPVMVKKRNGITGRSRGSSSLNGGISNLYQDAASFNGAYGGNNTVNPTGSVMASLISYGQTPFMQTISNAPESIKAAIESVSDFISGVGDTDIVDNEYGQKVYDNSYYSPEYRSIRLNRSKGEERYAEEYIHESFHAYDHKSGWLSQSLTFKSSIEADRNAFFYGQKHFQEMLDDAFESGAAEDSAISDILSAVFNNHPAIVSRYYDEIVPYYNHDNNYWSNNGTVEAEIFAECGCVMTYQNKASMEFLQKWFPSIDSNFRRRFDLLD